MDKILIDPMHCSREEYVDLIDYLEDNYWSFKKIKHPMVENRTFKVVGKRKVGGIQASTRKYVGKEKFQKNHRAQMCRYADVYGIAEAYELKENNWELISTTTVDDPLIGKKHD